MTGYLTTRRPKDAFRLSPGRPYNLVNRSKETLRFAIAKLWYQDSSAHDSARTLLDLPPEVVLLIADSLPLSDRASLAISARYLMPLLGYSCAKLNEAENKAERIELLRRFDILNASWLLCLRCARYHRWSTHHTYDCDVVPTIGLDKDADSHSAELRLVNRAKQYNNLAYGKPLQSLSKSHTSEHVWTTTTDAVLDVKNNLILRITSILKVFDIPSLREAEWLTSDSLRDKYHSAYDDLAFCSCGDPQTRQAVYDTCDKVVLDTYYGSRTYLNCQHGSWYKWRPDDIVCRCGAVYEVHAHCVSMAVVKHIPYIAVVRYQSLGLVGEFNHDHETHIREDKDNLSPVPLQPGAIPTVMPYYLGAPGLQIPPWELLHLQDHPYAKTRFLEASGITSSLTNGCTITFKTRWAAMILSVGRRG